MSSFRQVAIIVNQEKQGAAALAEDLIKHLNGNKVAGKIIEEFPFNEKALDGCDLAIAIGGDGTLLSLVKSSVYHSIPVLGVNMGRLGFMAHFSPEEIKADFDKILAGEFQISQRSLLQVTGPDNHQFTCLNDVVIKATGSKLISLRVSCNDEEMNTYHADGIIVSTPTGSTAYNLSAGGPIVNPKAKVIIVTPINPHTLSNRAIVLDESHCLEISQSEPNDKVIISGDGIHNFLQSSQFPLRIQINPDHKFSLVEKLGHSYHYVLRKKLRWIGQSLPTSTNTY